MPIVCPNCTTSYAIDPAKLGPNGRTVRCSRCKDTWLARAEDAVEEAPVFEEAMAEAGSGTAAAYDAAQDGWPTEDVPVVDSPSISTAHSESTGSDADPDWSIPDDEMPAKPASRVGRLLASLKLPVNLPPLPSIPVPQFAKHYLTLPIACVAMAALSLGIVVWRADVVRLMPQTAVIFKTAGLPVNLRGLAIENVKVVTEIVEGKPVLVIEGSVAVLAKKPLDVPRMRFVVHDEKGTEIYAWNSLLEKTTLQPGERAPFRTRLASPPAEAREIAVRFFNRRDIGA